MGQKPSKIDRKAEAIAKIVQSTKPTPRVHDPLPPNVPITRNFRWDAVMHAEGHDNLEEAIHAFMEESGTPRSDIFYATKLKDNFGYEHTLRAINKSLKACGLEYIDLYLLHSAIGGPEKRRECWRAVCEAKKAGKVKSIGVSNFGVAHLKEMLDQGVELPVLNQVKLNSQGVRFLRRLTVTSFLAGRSPPFHDTNRHR